MLCDQSITERDLNSNMDNSNTSELQHTYWSHWLENNLLGAVLFT